MRPLVILPTYNERDNLPQLVEQLLMIDGLRILVVDDASPDGTGQLADDYASRHRSRVQVLHRTGKRGLGLSYIDGMYVALRTDATHICQMDADLSHNPADVPRLLAASEKADFVVGSRYVPGGRIENWPLHRRVLSAFANRYIRSITKMTLRDCTSGFRCWRREALEQLPLASIRSDGYAFLVELAWEATSAHLRCAEVPITFVERRQGASKLSGRVIVESAVVPWRLAARPRRPKRTLERFHREARRFLSARCSRGTVYPPVADQRSTRPPGLTMFFPAYNDGGTIASLVILAVQVAGRLAPDFEVIVVNDGSTDSTKDILDELARTYPRVRVLHHPRNRGYGAALRTGFSAATKDLIAYTDGDAQYDPAELEVLWNHLTPDADMVTGYKIRRSDPWHRIVIGRLYHHTVRLLFRLRVRDVDCDFRLMRREIFDRVKLEKDTGVICLEMMRKIQDAGFRVVEVPVHHFHRLHGRSQFFNVKRVFWTGVDVLRLWVKLVVLGRGRTNSPVLFRNPTISGATPPESTQP